MSIAVTESTPGKMSLRVESFGSPHDRLLSGDGEARVRSQA